MPVKIQYPVGLGEGTKCPSCNSDINPMGGNVYVCQTGHVIEAVLIVTMRPKKAQQQVSVKQTEEPIVPSYDRKNVQTDAPLLPPDPPKGKVQ